MFAVLPSSVLGGRSRMGSAIMLGCIFEKSQWPVKWDQIGTAPQQGGCTSDDSLVG